MGIGTLLTFFAQIWSDASLVMVAAPTLWMLGGASIVTVRGLLALLFDGSLKRALDHRVLQIGSFPCDRGSADLGPRFMIVRHVDASDVPDDLVEMEDWLGGGVDTILVSAEIPPSEFGRLTDFALTHGCRMLCPPRSHELDGVGPQRVWLNGRPLSELTAPTLRASQLFFKRIVDVVVSVVLLTALAPVLLLVALVVAIDSPGPILFRQRRAGFRGEFFELMKFRSMRVDAEAVLKSDPKLYRQYVENDFKLPEDADPRHSRVGRILRKTSLDELPQLLNVLKGDMSIVGPRPVVEPELQMYKGRIPTLLSVKPGVTGPWQVSGRSRIAFPQRAQIDLEYVRTWSLLRDLWIMVITIPAVLLQRGAH